MVGLAGTWNQRPAHHGGYDDSMSSEADPLELRPRLMPRTVRVASVSSDPPRELAIVNNHVAAADGRS
jgi:hypothetical protein